MSATENEVRIMAGKAITLMVEGGAYIRLAGGEIEIGGPGRFVVKTASHSLMGPSSARPELPRFDARATQRRYVLEFDATSADANTNTIAAIAASGVDYVSVGRLTQSAPAADIGLDFTPLA